MYWVYWIDKYRGGYISGVTHAVREGETKTLCGIDMTNRPWDGGYLTTGEAKPGCKICYVKTPHTAGDDAGNE